MKLTNNKPNKILLSLDDRLYNIITNIAKGHNMTKQAIIISILERYYFYDNK